MADTLENFYNCIYEQLSNINVPNSLSNPVGNVFADKSSVMNSIQNVYLSLNRINSSLSRNPIDYIRWLKELRLPETGRDRVNDIAFEACHKFEKERGECNKIIQQKLAELREVI